MQAEATANPYQHSDVLGAVDLAAEELSTAQGNFRKVIVMLSDFIQDDARYNFNTSADLANERSAIALARKLSVNLQDDGRQKVKNSAPARNSGNEDESRSTTTIASTNHTFAGADIYLGLPRSKDLKKMPPQRREPYRRFGASTSTTGVVKPQ